MIYNEYFLYLFKEYLPKQKIKIKLEIETWKYVKSNRYKNEYIRITLQKNIIQMKNSFYLASLTIKW